MKLLLFAFYILFLTSGYTRERNYYTITNSYLDTALASDIIYVSGKVNYESTPAKNSFGKVASLDFSEANIVSRTGEFQIIYRKTAKGFYFYQEGFKEVVVDLSAYGKANHFEINIVGERFLSLIQAEKPVIYLYSQESIKTTLILDPVGDLSFTYPNYTDNWEVETQVNGDIKNLKTEKTHPYLFWEANQKTADFKKDEQFFEGYIIQTDSAVSFLENQLTSLGLNAKESTDFITYWAPRLMQKQFATIQFMIEEDYDRYFGKIASTTPLDYQLRIGMLYEISDLKPSIHIIPPSNNSFKKRVGFSLIEWGGIELKNKLILL